MIPRLVTRRVNIDFSLLKTIMNVDFKRDGCSYFTGGDSGATGLASLVDVHVFNFLLPVFGSCFIKNKNYYGTF